MPVSITANVSARYAQASISRQNEAVTQGTLRMSSGQRVLSAADDASAMAIGSSLKIENAGVKSAILNATSANSMLQIADGALGQISELLTRMKALATQSSSGQYDDATRVLLDGEFQGLKDEIERTANGTTFNDVKMLAGEKDFDLANGATGVAGVGNVRFDQSIVGTDQSFRYSYDSASENFTLTRVDGGATTTQTINITALMNGTVGAGGNLANNQTVELGFSQLGVTLTLGAGFLRTQDITTGVTVADGGVMDIASSSFVGTGNALPTGATTTLTALGAAYNATTGALNLPTTSDGTVLRLDAQAGISYAVNGGAIGAAGAASADLASTGPTTVDVYATSGTSRVLVGRVTLGDTSAPAVGTDTISLAVKTPGATGVPVATVDDLTALTGVYNTATGALTLPTTSNGTTVTLDAVPGVSYAVNGGAVGASGAASGDLVGTGPITVDVYVDAAAGGQVLLGRVTLGDVATTAAGNGNLTVNVGAGLMTATDSGEIKSTYLTYKVGTGVAAGIDTIGVEIPAMTLAALGLEDIAITTQSDANSAIDAMTAALAVLNQGRANVGAQQLRMESVSRSLGVVSENNEAAKSSLIDVDVSAEITEITTNQAMMEASIAMLSRANQLPDILLELLRN
jgi:flagellin